MMNKINKIFLRLIQQANRFVHINNFIGKSNVLSKLQFDLERLPNDLVKGMSKGLKINKRFPAGRTFLIEAEGKELTIEVLYKFRRVLDNMDSRGVSGIDIYILNEDCKYVWKETIVPFKVSQMYIKKIIHLDKENSKLKFIMPSFSIVECIYISSVYRLLNIETGKKADIVAYGSSITHGCAASRPGLSYLNQISNKLGCGILNYGFSESAKGEDKLLSYISMRASKVFIMEYDHNASIDELEKTHMEAYKIIRKNFKGWIIMLSRFSGGLSIPISEEKKRIRIIQKTFEYAKSIGDQYIIFYNGSMLFGDNKEHYFPDKIHPNDDGMTAIADLLCTIIQNEGMLK